MLEYDFSQLDDDFITLWSSYLLYHDTSLIIEPLQKLAEKGQINAIQSWYLLKKPEQQNQSIDKIVDSYYGDSFNEALAIANRIYSKTEPQLSSLEEQFYEYSELYYTYTTKGDWGTEQSNVYLDRANALCEEYRATEYAQQLKKAAALTELAAMNTGKASIMERLLEIYYGNPLILDNRRIGGHKKIRKVLCKRLEKNPQDSLALFTYAKNLILFSSTCLKDHVKGSDILSNLAKRTLITCSDENSNCSENSSDQLHL